MTKRKTSININGQVWEDFLVFVVRKTGSSRKVSKILAEALKEYMKNHSDEIQGSQ